MTKSSSFLFSFIIHLPLLADYTVFNHLFGDTFKILVSLLFISMLFIQQKIHRNAVIIFFATNACMLFTHFLLVELDFQVILALNFKLIVAICCSCHVARMIKNGAVSNMIIPRLILLYGATAFLLFPILQPYLMSGGFISGQTFYRVFWYDAGFGDLLSLPFKRAQAFFLEAGLFGLYAVIIAMLQKHLNKDFFLAVFCVLVSGSVAALIILFIFVIFRFRFSETLKMTIIVLASVSLTSFILYFHELGASTYIRYLDVHNGLAFILNNHISIFGGYYGPIEQSIAFHLNGLSINFESRGTSNGLIKLLAGFGFLGTLIYLFAISRKMPKSVLKSHHIFIIITLIHIAQPVTFGLTWWIINLSILSLTKLTDSEFQEGGITNSGHSRYNNRYR